jgi:hypothetical protein
VLHFGRKQILWECEELRACETFPMGVPSGMHKLQFSIRELEIAGFLEDTWIKIVREYSNAALTKPWDKLPAVGGIAERLCRMKDKAWENNKYIAGFFSATLPAALVWRRGGTGPLRRIMKPYRAPSWSWASCDGPIDMFPTTEADLLCDIVDINLSYAEVVNPYGQLSGGYITVSAPTLWVTWVAEPHTLDCEAIAEYLVDSKKHGPTSSDWPPDPRPSGSHTWKNRRDERRIRLYFDEDELAQKITNLALIEIADFYPRQRGLILKAGRDGTWVRIGSFSSNGASMSSTASQLSERTFKIN